MTDAPDAPFAPPAIVEAALESATALEPAIEPAPAFELPTARQVIGRGLQLALDGSRDIRRASIYIGLLLLAVVGPLLVLVIVDLPRIADTLGRVLGGERPTSGDIEILATVLPPLYGTAILASLGAVAVAIDGTLVAVAVLASRAIGRPIGLRAAIQRARRVFWRYVGAAVLVGIVSSITGAVVGVFEGPETAGTLGGNLLATLIAAVVTAPFGYVLTGIVIGDVGAVTAVRRSLTLTRARPWLALVVAAFAFLASAIQLFGLSAALEVAGDVAGAVNASLDPTSPVDAIGLVLLGAIALVAYGSLVVTVGAISVSPQVAAFLGLTHFTQGLEVAPPGLPARTRWVTLPMLALMGLTILIAIAGILAGAAQG